jgi:F0F1-type ATP synthase gamma subunit
MACVPECACRLVNEIGNRLATRLRTEENIGTLSADLSQTFHRLRQGSIDELSFDVIAGFKSLSAKTRVSR